MDEPKKRKHSIWFWCCRGLMALIAAYVLSVGPAARLFWTSYTSYSGDGTAFRGKLLTAYKPVAWMYWNLPEGLRWQAGRYGRLWSDGFDYFMNYSCRGGAWTPGPGTPSSGF